MTLWRELALQAEGLKKGTAVITEGFLTSESWKHKDTLENRSVIKMEGTRRSPERRSAPGGDCCMTEAYQLHWEEQHLNNMDADTDIVLERRADDADLPNWPEGTESPDVTGETVFGATFGQVSYTHYPVNDLRWPVMSRQMLDTLLSVGAFPHVAHPVAIVDALHYRGEALPLGEG